jgi:hypothetical protein
MKTIDLSDLKVGDKVWNIQKGEVKILEIEKDEFYPLLAGSSKHTYYRFKLNGLYHTDDQHPTLFHSEQEFREYWGFESNQLTKREQFAMAAMQGFKLQLGTEDFIYVEMAKQCVKFADALLTKLNETK